MMRKVLFGTAATVGVADYFAYTQDATAYSKVFMPIAQALTDAEDAHKWAVWLAAKQWLPRINYEWDKSLMSSTVLGLEFQNPVGMAAGFDKDGECVEGLARMGFGFVEAGSVTPLPQKGNPKPRVFRLPEDKAVINRYGFNSAGHAAVYTNLRNHINTRKEKCVLGINLGKNKTSESAIADYSIGVARFAELADYLVINVSSPNTPGLRNLQMKNELDTLISSVITARDKADKGVPLLLKIAPDLTEEAKKDIAAVVMKRGVDGLIISNTTIARPESLKSKNKGETGGLSGAPLTEKSTKVISDMYKLTGGKIPIIGVGGVSNGKDAYEKIKAGASLVQLYSAFAYEGPPLVKTILKELETLLKEDGHANVTDAIGISHK